MNTLRTVTVLVSLICAGLMAGLFAAFSYAVMPGMAKADAASSIMVMQRINTAILNPVFGLLFVGGLVASVLAVMLCWRTDLRWWVVAGAGLYVLGMLITGALNVPLNDQLAAAGTPSSPAAAVSIWSDFATSWVRWNLARAIIHLGGFAALAVGLVRAASPTV